MATYAYARCECGKFYQKKRYNTARGAGVGLYHLKRKALACCGWVAQTGTHADYGYSMDAARNLITLARSLAGVR
jgi:hypothetical protein